MKEYTIQVGEVFTKKKAKELKEYLELLEATKPICGVQTLEEFLGFLAPIIEKASWHWSFYNGIFCVRKESILLNQDFAHCFQLHPI